MSATAPVDSGRQRKRKRTHKEKEESKKRRRDNGANQETVAIGGFGSHKTTTFLENNATTSAHTLHKVPSVQDGTPTPSNADSEIPYAKRHRAERRKKKKGKSLLAQTEPTTPATQEKSEPEAVSVSEQQPGSKRKHAKQETLKKLEEEDVGRILTSAAKDPVSSAKNTDGEPALTERTPKSRNKSKKASQSGATPQKPSTLARDTSSWIVTEAKAGRYIDHDPIFSSDERVLFAANTREVQVLSNETSGVLRTLPAPGDDSVAAFSLSAVDPDHIYIAYVSGHIECRNWTSGALVRKRRHVPGQPASVSVSLSPSQESDVVYTISQSAHSSRILAGDRVLYSSNERLHSLHAVGHYIVAALPGKIVIGTSRASEEDGNDAVEYSWAEINIGLDATCLDARLHSNNLNAGKTKKSRSVPTETLSVAIGTKEGQILLYDNLLSLHHSVGDGAADASLTPSVLHWHREAVGSVKWSRDGNYLISGGTETVLVIWQIETGKKQFLPHLTAEIERLTVSPRGSSYAVQLADNSVMVLSTTELKPTANFPGLQSSVFQGKKARDEVRRPTQPVLLHPVHKDHLLLSVPASSLRSATDVRSRSFLEAYDLAADRHIARQALTRNNVTDLNRGPEGNKIAEPDVSMLQISKDGQWLATSEEWTPATPDVEFLAADRASESEESRARREVYLKIWRWNEDRKLWMLETRIDGPHQSAVDARPGRILALATDPTETGFATVGEDGCVRIWKPKTRLRNGIVVRGTRSEGLTDWSCRFTIQLEKSVEAPESPETEMQSANSPVGACIAYSNDGSVLAATQAFQEPGAGSTVHFINTATGELMESRSGLFSGVIKALSFLDRYLVVLSSTNIGVWDIVDDALKYSRELEPSTARTAGTELLAVSRDEGIFAFTTPIQYNNQPATRLHVCSPSLAKPITTHQIPQVVTALLSAEGRRGFTILTNTAEIRTLSSRASVRKATTQLAEVVVTTTAADAELAVQGAADEDEDVDMGDVDVDANADDSMLVAIEDDNERAVVRQEQLAQVFDVGQSFALPPVKDMFDAVVGLFGRKPADGAYSRTSEMEQSSLKNARFNVALEQLPFVS